LQKEASKRGGQHSVTGLSLRGDMNTSCGIGARFVSSLLSHHLFYPAILGLYRAHLVLDLQLFLSVCRGQLDLELTLRDQRMVRDLAHVPRRTKLALRSAQIYQREIRPFPGRCREMPFAGGGGGDSDYCEKEIEGKY
jgi:hypothetical protein